MSNRVQLSICVFMCICLVAIGLTFMIIAANLFRALDEFYSEHWRVLFWSVPALAIEAAWLGSWHAVKYPIGSELRQLSYPIFLLTLVLAIVSFFNAETLGIWLSMDVLPTRMWDVKGNGNNFIESLLTWFVILTNLFSVSIAWYAAREPDNSIS